MHIFKRFIPLIATAIVIVCVIASYSKGLKKTSNKVAYETEYSLIDSVPGISFEVKKSYTDVAQAVLDISSLVSFTDYQTYSYKNGVDTYLLFNIRNYIVMAKKGTEFNLKDGISNLSTKTLNGIWFTPIEDSVEKNNGRYTVKVSAEVVITNETYNDFTGYLTTVYDNDGTEYSLFVGAIQNEADKHTNDSLMLSSSYEMQGAIYEVEIPADNKEDVLESTDTSSEEPIEEPKEEPVEEPLTEPQEPEMPKEPVETNPTEEQEVKEPIEEPIKEEPIEEPEKEPEIETEEIKDVQIEETSAEDEEEKPSEEITPASIEEPIKEPIKEPTKEPISEPIEESIEEPAPVPEKEEKNVLTLNTNQQQSERSEDKAYTSNIYSMLNIGDTGYTMLLNNDLDYEETYIKVTKRLDDKETKEEIRKYIESGKAYYSEMKAPDGCHFEAVKYNAKFKSKEPYLNILLKGLDGEMLVYQGVTFSKRTYDIIYKDREIGWNNGLYVFYAVPNGCKEYVLQFGDGNGESIETSYYHIK